MEQDVCESQVRRGEVEQDVWESQVRRGGGGAGCLGVTSEKLHTNILHGFPARQTRN